MNPISFKGNTAFNVLYFSDVHSKTNNLSQFKTAVDKFDKENKDNNTLKLAGGDLCMDTAIKPNMLILKFMSLIGLDASSVGNHDLEGGTYFAEIIEKVKPTFKFLSANIDFSRENKVEDKIAKSTIIERKGERVGVIGISPLDYGKLTFVAPFNDFAKVKNFDDTVKSVKNEIKHLEKQGVNKIFLLAHTGKESKDGIEFYKQLAKIGGIDVIIGGHDHKEYDSWFTSDRGEPVKIVSVGKADDKDIIGEDLDSFGTLKTVFDNNGVLVPDKCVNSVEITQSYPKSKSILEMEEKLLHTHKIVTCSDKELSSKNRITEENPVGSLAADAVLYVVNKETKGQKAQIAFVNSGTVRGGLPEGDITVGDVKQALPFTSSTIIKTNLTKEQIINTLNWCAESTTLPKVAPGVMQVGGMRYTIGPDNKVKDVYLVNKDGSFGEKLDNQPSDKEYTVAYDIFLLTGVAGLSELKKEPNNANIEYYPHSRQDAVIEYFNDNFKNKPLEFKTNRIEIESIGSELIDKELAII